MKLNILYNLIFLFILVPSEVVAQDYSKMSRTLRKKVHQMETENRSRGAVRGSSTAEKEKEIFALIKTDGDLVENYCVSHQRNIHIVRIPLSKIAELSTDSRVIRIESEPNNASLTNDSVRFVTKTNMIHNGEGGLSQAYDGTDILVGVVDISFDYNHPTFLSKKDNRLRIQRVWDMLDGIESQTYKHGSAFPIGTLLKPEEIITKDHSFDSNLQFHGTHTAGTAVGSGYDSPYSGMAPEADIYMVNSIFGSNEELVPEDMREEIYNSTLQLLGFSNIFHYADSIGKPCVISFSAGDYGEITGENTLYYEYLTSMLGPGRILVASVGNEGTRGHVMYKTADQKSVGGLMTKTKEDASFFLCISSDKPLTFKIIDKSKPEAEGSFTFTPEYETTTSDTIACLDSLIIETFCYEEEYNSDKIGYDLGLYEGKKEFNDSVYSITISGADTEARIHIQNGKIEGAELGGNTFYPGEMEGIIGVGASTWRDTFTNINGKESESFYGTGGKRAVFSGCGPALSGKIKPDVLAPGVNVISAHNRTYQESHPTSQDNLVAKSTYNGYDYYWVTNNGTSMSTPVVAGIVALWLQAKPDLTPEEVIDVLAHTARHYDPSLTYPNNEYGYGEIDAYKGLLYILNLTNIEGLSTQHITNAKVRPMANGNVSISIPYSNNPTQVRIYNTNGQCIMQTVIPSHTTNYTINSFGIKGIFAVQVGNYGSTLIRIIAGH
jgi:subtilisin family serine protease